MKRLLILFCLLAIPLCAQLRNGTFRNGTLRNAQPAPEEVVVYVAKQDFEGAGYDNGETWSDLGGTINPDSAQYTSSGSQSVEIVGAFGALQRTNAVVIQTNSFFFTLSANTITAQKQIFYTFSNAVTLCSLWIKVGGQLAFYNDSDGFLASPPDTISSNTLVNIWADVDYVNKTYQLAWSTDAGQTRPTAGPKWTNGTFTITSPGVNKIWLASEPALGTNTFDKFRWRSQTSIGTLPQ